MFLVCFRLREPLVLLPDLRRGLLEPGSPPVHEAMPRVLEARPLSLHLLAAVRGMPEILREPAMPREPPGEEERLFRL